MRSSFCLTYLVDSHVYVQVLIIEGASFTWSSNDVSPTLEGVDLKVKKGELVGVFGRVGAGKVIFH